MTFVQIMAAIGPFGIMLALLIMAASNAWLAHSTRNAGKAMEHMIKAYNAMTRAFDSHQKVTAALALKLAEDRARKGT